MENVLSHRGLVGGHCIATFTVPVSAGDVEAVVVVCIESMHGAQWGESTKTFRGPFELAEHFVQFGVRRMGSGVPEAEG